MLSLPSEQDGLGGPLPRVVSAAREHIVLIGIVAAYVAAYFVVANMASVEAELQWALHAQGMLLAMSACAFVLIGSYFIRLGLADEPLGKGRRFTQDAKSFFSDTSKWAAIAIPLLLIPFFSSAFTSFKAMIPAIHPYQHDELFMTLDAWLHLGAHPWQITHKIFAGPGAAIFFDIAYTLWFPLMWTFVLVHVVELRRAAARAQFLISYVLVWIVLGTLLATVLSSGGPVYYGRLTGLSDPFEPLMASLRAMDGELSGSGIFGRIRALGLQSWLWGQYASGELTMGSGISAMPSLHVGVATLNALAAWRTHRALGWVMISFAATIQIASVHLGWHYAIDGYLSIILTIVIWKLVGLFVQRPGQAASHMTLH